MLPRGHSFENTRRANILLFLLCFEVSFHFISFIPLKDWLVYTLIASFSLLLPRSITSTKFCRSLATLVVVSVVVYTFHGHISSLSMAGVVPKALILGHSLVKRLDRDLRVGFDERAVKDFNLSRTASVRLHGIGGRTVPTLRARDLADFAPDIVILEISTNDLSRCQSEGVGSVIEDLTRLLLEEYLVRVVGVCHVIPSGILCSHSLSFIQQASLLNQYVSVVLGDFPNVFCWHHVDFNSSCKDLYLEDGVHLNASGQYLFYRS